jgi:predicted enzyme related to lactoylglutathione lyase
MADSANSTSRAATEPSQLELFMTVVKVAKWTTTVRWYTDTLGLAAVLVDREHEFALLAAGAGLVGIQGIKDGRAPEGASALRLVFKVPDLEQERHKLIARGVQVGASLDNSAEGYREVRLRDPEGNSVTLFTWLSPAHESRFPRVNR